MLIETTNLYKKLGLYISKKTIQYIQTVKAYYLLINKRKPSILLIYRYNLKETIGFLYIYIIKQYINKEQSLEPKLFH